MATQLQLQLDSREQSRDQLRQLMKEKMKKQMVIQNIEKYIADFQKQKSRRFISKPDKESLEKQIHEWNNWIHDHTQQIVGIDAKMSLLEAAVGEALDIGSISPPTPSTSVPRHFLYTSNPGISDVSSSVETASSSDASPLLRTYLMDQSQLPTFEFPHATSSDMPDQSVPDLSQQNFAIGKPRHSYEPVDTIFIPPQAEDSTNSESRSIDDFLYSTESDSDQSSPVTESSYCRDHTPLTDMLAKIGNHTSHPSRDGGYGVIGETEGAQSTFQGLCEVLREGEPELPGVILSEPQRRETVSPKGGKIQLEKQIGVSLSITRNSVNIDEDLIIQPSFCGPFEMPDGIESASPAYLIKTANEIEFKKDVDVKLQHNADLRTEEDCKDMVLLQASSTPTYKGRDPSPVYEFEEIDGGSGTFSPLPERRRFGSFKRRRFSSFFRIGRKRSEAAKDKSLYSARLYKAVNGIKIKAVFCMCQEHPQYIKHCDKVIVQGYSGMSDKAEGKTIFSALTMASEEVQLVNDRTVAWTVAMDKSMISKEEIDLPETQKIKISRMVDYPPRIVAWLSPLEPNPAPAVLRAMGLNKICHFQIASETVQTGPDLSMVDTESLQVAMEKLEAAVVQDGMSSNPMVTSAKGMVELMNVVLGLLHNPTSINTLVKRVEDIQELVKTTLRLAKGVKHVEDRVSKVSTISHQLKMVALVKLKSCANYPEFWPRAVDVLVGNATNLMKSIGELLVATEIAAIGQHQYNGVPLCLKSLSLLKWKDEDGTMQSFRLKDEISSQWEELGTLLDLSLNQMEVWRKECLGKIAPCWKRVIEHWLTIGGTPDYPATWDGLYKLLEDVGCPAIADKLKSIVQFLSKDIDSLFPN